MKLAGMPMKAEALDGVAEPGDSIHVEIQRELGVPGSKKLYVHINGQTILRICKIRNGKNGLFITEDRP